MLQQGGLLKSGRGAREVLSSGALEYGRAHDGYAASRASRRAFDLPHDVVGNEPRVHALAIHDQPRMESTWIRATAPRTQAARRNSPFDVEVPVFRPNRRLTTVSRRGFDPGACTIATNSNHPLHDDEPHFHVELSKVAGIGGRDGKPVLARREDNGGVDHVARSRQATELACRARAPIIE